MKTTNEIIIAYFILNINTIYIGDVKLNVIYHLKYSIE